jgi:hypothetical protein
VYHSRWKAHRQPKSIPENCFHQKKVRQEKYLSTLSKMISIHCNFRHKLRRFLAEKLWHIYLNATSLVMSAVLDYIKE